MGAIVKTDGHAGENGKRMYPNGIPDNVKENARTLWKDGRSERAIAGALGISKGSVANALDGLKAAQDGNKVAKAQHKKDRQSRELEDVCKKILGGVTKAKVKKAGLSQLSVAYGIFFDKIQLLNGDGPADVKSLPMLVVEVHAHMARQRAAPLPMDDGPVIEATVIKPEATGGGMGG